MADVELFYNLVTRDALVVYRDVAHRLEGPFSSREEAQLAAKLSRAQDGAGDGCAQALDDSGVIHAGS